MSSFTTAALLSSLLASAGGQTIKTDFTPIARAGGEAVSIARFSQGEQTYTVRCALSRHSQLSCTLSGTTNSGIRTLQTNDVGAQITVVGLDGCAEVSQTIQLKEITRDLKEKLTYIAEDYEEELEKCETSSDLEK